MYIHAQIIRWATGQLQLLRRFVASDRGATSSAAAGDACRIIQSSSTRYQKAEICESGQNMERKNIGPERKSIGHKRKNIRSKRKSIGLERKTQKTNMRAQRTNIGLERERANMKSQKTNIGL
jgi:hypothetical protein